MTEFAGSINAATPCDPVPGSRSKLLRLITYLSPSMPLELYQTYQYYLEEALGCQTMLCVEPRWSSPPPEKLNPFTEDQVDIGFMCSTGYIAMADVNPYIELLPLAPLHEHPKAESRPVYFTEIIVLKDNAPKYKYFTDLRGYKFAVTDAQSLSGNIAIRAELHKIASDATFFQLVHTESCMKSLECILNGTADAAGIDSSVFSMWSKKHPALADKLSVLCSLGPFPIQPIILNKRLPEETKKKIQSALESAHKHPQYKEKFLSYGVKGFEKVDAAFYDLTRKEMHAAKEINWHCVYY